jgi:hypothetical protein
MPNLLDDIIQKMEASGDTSKTASATPAPNAGLLGSTELQAALEKAASADAPPADPVASDPVEGLMTMAAKLASAEQDANVAEAHMLGAAIADGFLSKMAATEQAVKEAQVTPFTPTFATPQPSAAYVPAVDPEIEKVAAHLSHLDDVSLQKVASSAGYQAVMEKAAEDFREGHDAALQEVANGAYYEFLKGASETEVLLQRHAARASQ